MPALSASENHPWNPQEASLMTTDALRERGDSLEDAFFRNMDRKLIDDLRAKKEREEQLDELAAASGIAHREVLGALLDAGMHGEALVAAGLVPLIEVAWSDHAMDAKERDAIMHAARDAGVTRGSTAAELLSAWLERRPGAELLEAWKGYAAALVAELDEADAEAVRGDIMSRAQAVAEAAAGFLGIGSVSRAQRRMLAELAAALGG
ncbi:MAG: hypothetical protein F4230_05110 [Holophagales bacterium]|nr:hypothetical protein [Holophagales bacterium]